MGRQGFIGKNSVFKSVLMAVAFTLVIVITATFATYLVAKSKILNYPVNFEVTKSLDTGEIEDSKRELELQEDEVELQKEEVEEEVESLDQVERSGGGDLVCGCNVRRFCQGIYNPNEQEEYEQNVERCKQFTSAETCNASGYCTSACEQGLCPIGIP